MRARRLARHRPDRALAALVRARAARPPAGSADRPGRPARRLLPPRRARGAARRRRRGAGGGAAVQAAGRPRVRGRRRAVARPARGRRHQRHRRRDGVGALHPAAVLQPRPAGRVRRSAHGDGRAPRRAAADRDAIRDGAGRARVRQLDAVHVGRHRLRAARVRARARARADGGRRRHRRPAPAAQEPGSRRARAPPRRPGVDPARARRLRGRGRGVDHRRRRLRLGPVAARDRRQARGRRRRRRQLPRDAAGRHARGRLRRPPALDEQGGPPLGGQRRPDEALRDRPLDRAGDGHRRVARHLAGGRRCGGDRWDGRAVHARAVRGHGRRHRRRDRPRVPAQRRQPRAAVAGARARPAGPGWLRDRLGRRPRRRVRRGRCGQRPLLGRARARRGDDRHRRRCGRGHAAGRLLPVRQPVGALSRHPARLRLHAAGRRRAAGAEPHAGRRGARRRAAQRGG